MKTGLDKPDHFREDYLIIKGRKPVLNYGDLFFAKIFSEARSLLPSQFIKQHLAPMNPQMFDISSMSTETECFAAVCRFFHLPITDMAALSKRELPFVWLDAPEDKRMAFQWQDSFFKIAIENAEREGKINRGETKLKVAQALRLWSALLKMKGPQGQDEFFLRNMDTPTAMLLQKASLSYVLGESKLSLAAEDIRMAHARNQTALYVLNRGDFSTERTDEEYLTRLLHMSVFSGVEWPNVELLEEGKIKAAAAKIDFPDHLILKINMIERIFEKLRAAKEITVILDDNYESMFDMAFIQSLMIKYPELKVNFILNSVSINISKATFDLALKDEYFSKLRAFIQTGRAVIYVEDCPFDSFQLRFLSPTARAALKRSDFSYVKGQNFFETLDNSDTDTVYAFVSNSENVRRLTGTNKDDGIVVYIPRGERRFEINNRGGIVFNLSDWYQGPGRALRNIESGLEVRWAE